MSKPNIRIGFGFDVHQLIPGEEIVIGGISIPSQLKALGHSDADVLIHAICDAILGAANLRDIGFNFPDTDQSLKGIDSKILLKRTMELTRQAGYDLINIDATLVLERPKINPHIDKMKSVLAQVIGCEENDISIKATTSEKIGYVGREEGVCAYASALIYKV